MIATQAQCDYLSILFVDCGFTHAERKAFLVKRTGRSIAFLDELTKAEASAVISELRDLKDRKWAPTTADTEDD